MFQIKYAINLLIVILKFKERVKDLGQDVATLLRFLRAREYDLAKAETMLRKVNNIYQFTIMHSFIHPTHKSVVCSADRNLTFDLKKFRNMNQYVNSNQCIDWRKTNEINTILEWEMPSFLTESMPFEFRGLDNEGSPGKLNETFTSFQ